MKIRTKEYYQELESITKEIIETTTNVYAKLSFKELLKKPAPEKWSIAECMQHLVAYGDFYLNAMENSLAKNNKNSEQKENFKPSFFGNKFAEMLRYKETNMKKMKAPNIEVLTFDTVDENIIEIFIAQQEKHLEILSKTKNLNLTKLKVPIALTKLIKTNIGDTLRFTIYHNQRHFIQAQKVYEKLYK